MFVNNKDIYLVSCNTLKNKSLINKNVDDSYIMPAIKVAQDICLVELLGFDLVNKICTMVEANTLSGLYETLLKQYILDYLCFKVLSEILIPLWAKTRNEGIINANGTEFTNIYRNDVDYTKEYYDNLAIGMFLLMEKFLNDNKDNLPEWKKVCGNNIKYNTHIYLGL